MNLKTCKRGFISVVMALVMLTTCVCAATTDTTASIMRFEKGIGFYSISNAIGREVTVREGGRVYSGYQVNTGLGYAWVSLDDDKVIKLGWNTQITITKDGNKLEVLVDSGEIFFDISEALDEDESLAIRTSTMYSGIRGTSGTVSVRTEETIDESGNNHKEKISTLTVYDGTVAATTVSQETFTPQTEMVSASQQAIATQTTTESGTTTSASATTIAVIDLPVAEALTEAPFAAVEVADNSDLQARIEQANQSDDTDVGADLSSVLDSAQDTLSEKEESDSVQAESTTQTVDEAQEEVSSSTGSSSVESAFPSSNSSEFSFETLINADTTLYWVVRVHA